MKKTVFSFFVLFLILSLWKGANAQNLPEVCQGKPPHILAGFTQPKDPIEIFAQISQIYMASWSDSNVFAPMGANLGERTELTFYEHTLTLYLPMYRRAGGVVYYHTAAGLTPISEREFSCVKGYISDWIKTSIDRSFEDHQKITELAIAGFAKRQNKSTDEVRGLLSKTIPEYGTNYSDVLAIPQFEPADFIKSVKHAYLVPMRSCNAAVSINTILMFTPCVMRMDYVLGYPQTMKHELIHANIKLQGIPIGWYVNMELLAALFPFLESPVNLDTFFYHSYLSSPWEVLYVFGGLDIKKMRKEIFRYEVYPKGAAMNREALVKYMPEINKAAQWLRESAIKVLTEYYLDQGAWAAVNDMSHDNDMAYKVIMAKLYEPTLLGGHAATTRFILKHADQSGEVAKRSWDRVGKPMDFGNDQKRTKLMEELKEMANLFGFTLEKLARIGKYYGFRPEHFEKLDSETIRMLLSDFLNKDGAFKYLDLEVR